MSDDRGRRTTSRASASGPAPGSAPTCSPPADARRRAAQPRRADEEELAEVARDRELQRMLFDAGLAGSASPRSTAARASRPRTSRRSTRSSRGYEYPIALPGADLLAVHGGAPRLRHRGAEAAPHPRRSSRARSCGCSSSPSRAAAPTSPARSPPPSATATSGSSTARRSGPPAPGGPTGACAWPAPTGTCPSTAASRVFIFPIHQPGIEIQRIEMLNGSQGVLPGVPDRPARPRHRPHRRGRRRLDRRHPLDVPRAHGAQLAATSPCRPAARSTAAAERGILDGRPRRRAASTTPRPRPARRGRDARRRSATQLKHRRARRGCEPGTMSDQASAIGRLFHGTLVGARSTTIAFELAGAAGGAWVDDDGALAERGIDFLMRQVGSIGGGTTEMARNVISERVLGMPRERRWTADVPFRDVPRSASSSSCLRSAHDDQRRQAPRSSTSSRSGRSSSHRCATSTIRMQRRSRELFEEDGVLQLVGTVIAGREALRGSFGGAGVPPKWTHARRAVEAARHHAPHDQSGHRRRRRCPQRQRLT